MMGDEVELKRMESGEEEDSWLRRRGSVGLVGSLRGV